MPDPLEREGTARVKPQAVAVASLAEARAAGHRAAASGAELTILPAPDTVAVLGLGWIGQIAAEARAVPGARIWLVVDCTSAAGYAQAALACPFVDAVVLDRAMPQSRRLVALAAALGKEAIMVDEA